MEMVRGINDPGRSVLLNSGRHGGKNNGPNGTSSGSEGLPRVTFGDEQRQPWRVVQTWLDLRHDLAVVALLQVGEGVLRASPPEPYRCPNSPRAQEYLFSIYS